MNPIASEKVQWRNVYELGATHDWVVIYRDDEDGAGQWTVITSRYGPLRDKRIVRGRETECETYYVKTVEGTNVA